VSHGDDVGTRVRDAIIEAADSAQINTCDRVVAGLTALPDTQADVDFLADQIAAALDAGEVWIADDTVTAHRAAFEGRSGIVLVVGTGIACLAVDSVSGSSHRTSGSGYLIGDEGGAYWIGRKALAAAIKSADGRGPATSLLGCALARFGGPAEELAVRVHNQERTVSAIAEFAVDVVVQSESGDEVALGILRQAATELAEAVSACVTSLPGSATGGVALMGRVVTGSPSFAQLIRQAITQAVPALECRLDVRSPLDGAVAMASDTDAGVYGHLLIARSDPTRSDRRPVGSAARAYLGAARATLEAAASMEFETIVGAAHQVADRLQSGGMIHTFGTGHSHMLAEELFYRAGGLARVDPILVGELMLHESASGSTQIERQSGLAQQILVDHPIDPRDVLIVASNSGGNAVSLELAQLAKDRGVFVIALTSLTHATSKRARSNGGRRLHDLADVVLDNHGAVGDAAVTIAGLDRRVGATSTVVGSALLQALAAETVALLVDRGADPEVFSSSNTAGGDEINNQLLGRYMNRVRAL
jgi:uncharacterized phosphosugar-binding protein/N-acetylglucosamine kinase-like BadF-type ATPase